MVELLGQHAHGSLGDRVGPGLRRVDPRGGGGGADCAAVALRPVGLGVDEVNFRPPRIKAQPIIVMIHIAYKNNTGGVRWLEH